MAAKKILKEDRSKGNDASVKDKDKGKEKEYDNKSLGVDNKNPDNKDLKNTVSDIEKEIEKAKAPILPEQKITDIRTYGSDKDYIVVEMVGKYRNIWNYITKQDQIKRQKENSKDWELIPIDFKFEESKEIEFLLSQTEKIFLEGVEVPKSLENLIKFSDKHGEILSDALMELITENKEQIKKQKAKIIMMIMLEHV